MSRPWAKLAAAVLLAAASVAVLVLSLGIGAVDIAPTRVVALMRASLLHTLQPGDSRDAVILTQIRMPRTLLGFSIGGALAVSGALLQGLFRNPLADPGLVGVSSGAGLAAAVTIVLGDRWAPELMAASTWLLSLTAFAGSFGATLLLYRIATRRGQTSIPTLLLAGVALGAFAGALTGLLVFMSNDSQLRDLTFWMLGSLGGATWRKVIVAVGVSLLLAAVIPFLARDLNALALGEAEAFHLGLSVQRTKRLLIGIVSVAVGSSVALAGPIAFVGILVPHMLRLCVGADNRFVLPASLMLGGILLTGADLLARTLAAPAEIPIGIVTAALGAPFFLWLLLARWREIGG